MIGILLITHAPLGQAFVATAAHMFSGKQERIEVIDVQADQDPSEVNALAIEAITRIDDGSGVLVMTDVMGGTPSNCCRCCCAPSPIARTIWKRWSRKPCPVHEAGQ
jgi:PTS system mannose-specific IIA component